MRASGNFSGSAYTTTLGARASVEIEAHRPCATRDDETQVTLRLAAALDSARDAARELVERDRQRDAHPLARPRQTLEVVALAKRSLAVRAHRFERTVTVEKTAVEDADAGVLGREQLAVDVDDSGRGHGNLAHCLAGHG